MKQTIERKYLRELTNNVRTFIKMLDAIMKQPSTEERGKQIATLMNGLEIANDAARHFVLGEEL